MYRSQQNRRDNMDQKKLTKSLEDRKLCGVCGGIGEYVGIDSTVIREIGRAHV